MAGGAGIGGDTYVGGRLYGTSKYKSNVVLSGAASRTINFTAGFREACILISQISTSATASVALTFTNAVTYSGGTCAVAASSSSVIWTAGQVTLWNNLASTTANYCIRITLIDDVPASPLYMISGTGNASTNNVYVVSGYVTTSAPFTSMTISAASNFDNGVVTIVEYM